MVLVTWQRSTGELVDISPADGPGEYTDDVQPGELRDALDEVDEVSEKSLAVALISIYHGHLSDSACQATVDVFEEEDGSVRAIAFVEAVDEEDRIPTECTGCDYVATEPREWSFRERRHDGWVYHDWVCTSCDTVVHTELVTSPGTPTATSAQ